MRFIDPLAVVLMPDDLRELRVRAGILGALIGGFFGGLIVYLVR